MDKSATEREIVEGLNPVCICKGIRKRVFEDKIRSGCAIVEDLGKSTGGSGSCKGERCTPRIRELLEPRK